MSGEFNEKAHQREAVANLLNSWDKLLAPSGIKKIFNKPHITKKIERWVEKSHEPTPEHFAEIAEGVWTYKSPKEKEFRKAVRDAISETIYKYSLLGPNRRLDVDADRSFFRNWIEEFIKGIFSNKSEKNSVHAWILDEASAKSHLELRLNLKPGADFFQDEQGALPDHRKENDPYAVARLKERFQMAFEAQSPPVKTALLRGPIGIGKTILLLRYLASEAGSGTAKFLFNAQGFCKEGYNGSLGLRELLNFVRTELKCRAVLVIDGLDIGSRYHPSLFRRSYPMRPSEILHESLKTLEEELRNFPETADLCIILTADDRLTGQRLPTADMLESWVSKFSKVKDKQNILEWKSSSIAATTHLWKQKYPFAALSVQELAEKFNKHTVQPLLPAIILDALRRLEQHNMRDIINYGISKLLSRENHQMGRILSNVMYETASDLKEFRAKLTEFVQQIDEFEDNEKRKKSSDEHYLVKRVELQEFKSFDSALEQEKSWEWIDLLKFEPASTTMVQSLWKLFDRIAEVPWKYGGSHALSNIVSILVLLNEFKDAKTKQFYHGNLSNVLLRDDCLCGWKFFGVNFSGAEIEGKPVVRNSKFFACAFDPKTDSVVPERLKVHCKLDRG